MTVVRYLGEHCIECHGSGEYHVTGLPCARCGGSAIEPGTELSPSDPRSVACPHCNAPAGSPCAMVIRDETGWPTGELDRRAPHEARVQRARVFVQSAPTEPPAPPPPDTKVVLASSGHTLRVRASPGRGVYLDVLNHGAALGTSPGPIVLGPEQAKQLFYALDDAARSIDPGED